MADDGLPDFVIIGAPRAGTTSLYHILDRAPSICMSSIKEPRYFEREVGEGAFATRRVSDRGEYLSLWSNCGEGRIRGEASPVYLFDPGTPSAMAVEIPNARLILSVRHPVDRAISHYFFREQRTGRSERSLRECIDSSLAAPISDYERSYLIEPGMYGRNLLRWLQHYPMEQIHVVVFEELANEPAQVIDDLAGFLKVAPPQDVGLSFRESNAATLPRSRVASRVIHSSVLRSLARRIHADQMARKWGERLLTSRSPRVSQTVSEDDRTLLNEIYREDVGVLSSLLQRDLPWNLTSSSTEQWPQK